MLKPLGKRVTAKAELKTCRGNTRKKEDSKGGGSRQQERKRQRKGNRKGDRADGTEKRGK